jgi:hypothetical protein
LEKAKKIGRFDITLLLGKYNRFKQQRRSKHLRRVKGSDED